MGQSWTDLMSDLWSFRGAGRRFTLTRASSFGKAVLRTVADRWMVSVVRKSHKTRFEPHLDAILVATIKVRFQEVPERRPIDWGTVSRMRPKNALR